MEGWIKIHRQIKNHWIWEDPIYLKAWLGILLSVNHEDKKVLIQGELIECKRGQSLLSLGGWVKCFGKKWTMQRVRTFFELLKQDEMIATEGLRKTTRLTVCKYDDYQFEQQAKNKQRTSRQQGDNKEITTNKNDKNDKEYKYNAFYDFEIEKSESNENYIRLVRALFGENSLSIPLKSVLSMPEQLSYEQFQKLWFIKETYKISLVSILEEMENWIELKKRKTVFKTFLTFAKNKNKEIKVA